MTFGRRRLVAAGGAAAVFVGTWQTASLIVGDITFPGPWGTITESFATLLYNPTLAAQPGIGSPGLGIHIMATFARVLFAVTVGLVLGISIAISLRVTGPLGRVILGSFDLPRVLPPLMFVPLSVFWFAPSESAILFAACLYSVSTFVLFANIALSDAEEIYLPFLSILNEPGKRRYFSVILPAALPALLGGFRLSSAIVLGIVLVVEYFIGQIGLGKVLLVALYQYDVRLLFAVVFWCILMVLVLDLVVVELVRCFRPDLRKSDVV